jgi:hypothetical protein
MPSHKKFINECQYQQIYMENLNLWYMDSFDNLLLDCKTCGLPPIPNVPENILLYFAAEDADSYCADYDQNILPFSATGLTPEFFFTYIDSAQALITAQKNRNTPKK